MFSKSFTAFFFLYVICFDFFFSCKMWDLGQGLYFCLWVYDSSSTFLSIEWLLHLCQRLVEHLWVYCWVLSFSFIHVSVPPAIPTILVTCSYIVNIILGRVIALTTFIFLNIGLSILRFVTLHINFTISLSMSTKNFALFW